FNRQLMLEAKKIIGCKSRDELKYSTLKRHPKKQQVLNTLGRLKIKVDVFSQVKDPAKAGDGKVMNVISQAYGILHGLDQVFYVVGVARAEVWVDDSNSVLEKQIRELILDEHLHTIQICESGKIAEIIHEPHFVS